MYFCGRACFSVVSPTAVVQIAVFPWPHRHVGNFFSGCGVRSTELLVLIRAFSQRADQTLFCWCQLVVVLCKVSSSRCRAFSIRGPLVPASRSQHPAFPLALSPAARSRRFCCHSTCCTEFLGSRTSLSQSRRFLGDSTVGRAKTNVVLDNPAGCIPFQAPGTAISPSRGLLFTALCLHFSVAAALRPRIWEIQSRSCPSCAESGVVGWVLQGWVGGARRSSEPVTGELQGHSLFPAPPPPPHGFRLGLQNAVLWRRRWRLCRRTPRFRASLASGS